MAPSGRGWLRAIVLALALAAGTGVPTDPAKAQAPGDEGPDRTVDAATRSEVLAACLAALEKSYVFPEAARRVSEALRARERAGAYAAVTGARDFARRLTDDLQAQSRDKHLRVRYHAGVPPRGEAGAERSAEDEARRADFLRATNYGFEKAERLPGNIGYLEVRSFNAPDEAAAETVAASMGFLANADALIVDLRANGGGNPALVARLSSYLFDERTHLNSLHWREGGRIDEFWTSEVPGRRFGGAKPVYVLTSARTFSGAEEFAYNLQSRRRATIVGETSGGGAHPGGPERVHDHFSIWIPRGRAVNPVTGTNWEGTGVVPDHAVAAEHALVAAQQLALEALAASEPSEAKRAALEKRRAELEKASARAS